MNEQYSREMERQKAAKAPREMASECSGAAQGVFGYGNGRNVTPGPLPIRLRIERALDEAAVAVERANAADRARAIINEHPEFAELLDLLQRF